MRSMRVAKRQVTSDTALREILDACRVVRLGAQDADGMFIVPMNFGYEWNGTEQTPQLVLYVHSACEGRKADAFARGGRVAIEMDLDLGIMPAKTACGYSCRYRSLMGSGTAVAVEDPVAKEHALSLIMAHLAPDAPRTFPPAMIERTAVFRIEVDDLTGKENL